MVKYFNMALAMLIAGLIVAIPVAALVSFWRTGLLGW